MKKTIAFQILLIIALIVGALYEGYHFNLSWVIHSLFSILILLTTCITILISLFHKKTSTKQSVILVVLCIFILFLTFKGYRQLFNVGKQMWINNTKSKTEWTATYERLDSLLGANIIKGQSNTFRYNHLNKRIECNNSLTCEQTEQLNRDFHKEIKSLDNMRFKTVYRDSSKIVFEDCYRDFGCCGFILTKDGMKFYRSLYTKAK